MHWSCDMPHPNAYYMGVKQKYLSLGKWTNSANEVMILKATKFVLLLLQPRFSFFELPFSRPNCNIPVLLYPFSEDQGSNSVGIFMMQILYGNWKE